MVKISFIFLNSWIWLVFIANFAWGQQPAVKVAIETGEVQGFVDLPTGTQVFLGIPYAKPPTGTKNTKPRLLMKWHDNIF